ncbi:hypothetical protein ABT115_11690 [Streptomyces sp. NPDC001832]|uniref:hypothetical protein n=1 Tax=Streptomyces sp. NPDC001832 TaxID=3154527 RepID=UPI00332E36D4
MVESDDLAVAPVGAGDRTFDNKMIAEVSSHDRHRFLIMLLYSNCHAQRAAAVGSNGPVLGPLVPQNGSGRLNRGRLVPDPLET